MKLPFTIFQLPNHAKHGQAMVLSVMLISGAVMTATAAVGILMIYEIRQAGNAIDSAKALFAADAGVECAIMQHKEGVNRGCGDNETSTLSDGKTTFKIYDISPECPPQDPALTGRRSVGVSNKIARSFEVCF